MFRFFKNVVIILIVIAINGYLITEVHAAKEAILSSAAIRTLTAHQDSVLSIAFSKTTPSLLASGSKDHTIMLWDVTQAESKPKAILKGHHDKVYAVAFSVNGKLLASASTDDTVKFWEVNTGQVMNTFSGTGEKNERVSSLAFSADGHFLATGHWNNNIKLWNLEQQKYWRTIGGGGHSEWLWGLFSYGEGHENSVNSVAFNLDGTLLATASFDKTVKIWKVDTAKLIRTLTEPESWVLCLAVSPDGKILAAGGYDQTIRFWDFNTGQLLKTLAAAHKAAVSTLAFHPNNQLLASGGFDETVKLWDVKDMKNINLIDTRGEHEDYVNTVAFSADGKYLATGSGDKTIKLWQVNKK